MRGFLLYLLPLTMAVALLVVAGCSDDDPTEPDPEVWLGLEGQVVDGQGTPLTGVPIGIIYQVPAREAGQYESVVIVDPASKPSTTIAYEIPETGPVRIWLTDYAGDFVVTLIDETEEAGITSVIWQGVDEAGDRVASGVYYAHLLIGDDPEVVHEILLVYLSANDFLTAPNATTDLDGTFQIPDNLIPVGETVVGAVDSEFTIPAVLKIVAVLANDPDPLFAQVTVEYDKGEFNGGIELVLH